MTDHEFLISNIHRKLRRLRGALRRRLAAEAVCWLVLVFSSRQIGVAVAVMVLVAVLLSWHTVDVPVNRGSMLVMMAGQ